MADQLTVYNGSLLICGERFLSSLTEEREPRRLLDQVWADGGVRTCLELGQWNFATRTIQVDYDSGIEPDFGYRRVFDKPDDFVIPCAVCSDEFFRSPLTRYVDEAGYWYADLDTIYVRYVSDDVAYGMNIGRWPESFRELVQVHFASKIIKKLSNSEAEVENLLKLREKLLRTAKNRSLLNEPTSFPARGQWGLARQRYPTRRDGGGMSGPLIG